MEYDGRGCPNQRNRSDTAGLYSCGAACSHKAFVSHAEVEFARMEVLQDPETFEMNDFPTLAFAARASAEDGLMRR